LVSFSMTICQGCVSCFARREAQESFVSLLSFGALEGWDYGRGLEMCCGRDRSDCGCASGRDCVCEMGCGVVDWVMVGERLSGVVSARASAKLRSKGCESRYRASV
jgi:hypothetical protein